MSEPDPAPTAKEHKPDFGIRTLIGGDGVRGLGAVFVFTTHMVLVADPDPESNVAAAGWAAPLIGHIDLALSAFFVLSGYLIARPFTRAYVMGTRRPRVPAYARNRVLRVVPAFYLFTVLILLRFGLDGGLSTGPGAQTSEWWQVLGQFLFVQAQTGGPAAIPIGQAWSIGAEVGFYFLIPVSAAVAYAIGMRIGGGPWRRALFALAAIAFVFLASIALRTVDKESFEWLTSPPAIMYGFMPGVALAIVEPLFATRLRGNARVARPLAWSAFAAGLLCAVVYAATDYDVRQTAIHHVLGQRAVLAALSTGLLFFGLVVLQLGTERAPWLFSNRPLAWLGARSYSFYLVHAWVLFELEHALREVEDITTRAIVMTLVAFPVTTLIAALSYRYVELPFLARKRRAAAADPQVEAPEPAPPPVAVEPAR